MEEMGWQFGGECWSHCWLAAWLTNHPPTIPCLQISILFIYMNISVIYMSTFDPMQVLGSAADTRPRAGVPGLCWGAASHPPLWAWPLPQKGLCLLSLPPWLSWAHCWGYFLFPCCLYCSLFILCAEPLELIKLIEIMKGTLANTIAHWHADPNTSTTKNPYFNFTVRFINILGKVHYNHLF